MEEEAEAIPPHPLLLSPVIHSVMEFLSIRDLITSRLVCRNWNKGACTVLRKTKTLKFRMQPEHLQDYVNTMKDSQDFPYSHYELEFYHMNEGIVQNFLQICGKSILSLQLNNCRCTTARLLEILLALKTSLKCFSLNCDAIKDEDGPSDSANHESQSNVYNSEISTLETPTLPKLKSLSLFGEFCENQQLIYDLLKSSPNLESIAFRCYDNLSEISTFETMCYEVFIQPSICLENLTSFQMKSKLNNNQILGLLTKKLKYLNSLHINLDCSVRPDTLLKLLLSFARNLKKLDITFGLEDNKKVEGKANEGNNNENNGEEDVEEEESLELSPTQWHYTFPPMNNLYRLHLSNYKGSLGFINDCVKLKYLAVVNCDLNLVTLSQVKRHPLKSLISTTLLDCEVCSKIAQVFPDLKELNVELDDQVLRTVFEIMPELEELTIIGDKVTDDGLTGIDNVYGISQICENVNLDSDLSFLLNCDGTLEQFRKHPSIANLTKLRKIQIQNAGFISDASVVHGLVLCNNLSEISLLNSKVTDCSLRAIADNLPRLRRLETLSYLQSVTSQAKDYIRTKLTDCDFILGQQDIIYLLRPRQIRTC